MTRVLNIYTFVLFIFVCFGVGRADEPQAKSALASSDSLSDYKLSALSRISVTDGLL